MSESRLCKNCRGQYKDHIDYTFTEYSEVDWTDSLVDKLTEALAVVKCTHYKPMNNLEYLEYVSQLPRRDYK